jgi:hypothetical protein
MRFQMQEESQQSPQIEFESDSESQRNIAAQDETTQDVTEQDAILLPVPRRNKKKKQPAIYGSKKLFAYSSKLAIAMKARLLEFLWAKY